VIGKLVGTTKPTIQAIRDRSHWNISQITPIDPVALGLCRQSELDGAVQKAASKKSAEGKVMTDDERRKLVSTETSLGMSPDARNTPDLGNFALPDDPAEDEKPEFDADSLFKLPSDDPRGEDDEDDEFDPRGRR
jgi:uncharacterized protein